MTALVSPSRDAATSASIRPSSGASPTTIASTGAPCDSSTSIAAARSASARRSPGPRGLIAREPGAQLPLLAPRQPATSSRSPACFCIRASVWRTESCRWAATSARSSERARPTALRRLAGGTGRPRTAPRSVRSAIVTTRAASATLPAASSEPVAQSHKSSGAQQEAEGQARPGAPLVRRGFSRRGRSSIALPARRVSAGGRPQPVALATWPDQKRRGRPAAPGREIEVRWNGRRAACRGPGLPSRPPACSVWSSHLPHTALCESCM